MIVDATEDADEAPRNGAAPVASADRDHQVLVRGARPHDVGLRGVGLHAPRVARHPPRRRTHDITCGPLSIQAPPCDGPEA